MDWNPYAPSALRAIADNGIVDTGIQYAVQNADRKGKKSLLVLKAQWISAGAQYYHDHCFCFAWHIWAYHSGDGSERGPDHTGYRYSLRVGH